MGDANGSTDDGIKNFAGAAKPDDYISEALERQTSAIPIALEALLIVVDQVRQLFHASTSGNGRIQIGTRKYHGSLSVRERVALDRSLNVFYDNLDAKLDAELARLSLLPEADNEGNDIYPLSYEMLSIIYDLLLGKVTRETLQDHFGKLESDRAKSEYVLTQLRLGHHSARESTLGSAILPLIVSKLEEFIGALLRVGLMLHPKALGEPRDIPYEIYSLYKQNLASIDIDRWQADQKITEILKGSPSTWCTKIVGWTQIDMTKIGINWQVINELINRRNVVTHQGGRVDVTYLKNVDRELTQGLRIGSYLECGNSYIEPVLLEVETWAMCAASLWAKHFFGSDARYYPFTINRIVALESSAKWHHALAILNSYLQPPMDPKSEDVAIARINRLFCMQEIGHDEDDTVREIRQWLTSLSRKELEDYSYIKVGIYALLKEHDQLLSALRRVISQSPDGLSKRDYRDMPLLQRAMRESSQIRRYLTSSEFVSEGSHGPRNRSKGRH